MKIEPMPGPEANELVVAIEYRKRRPFTVLTREHWDHRQKRWYKPRPNVPGHGWRRNDYSIEWCAAHGALYWHHTGSGPEIEGVVTEVESFDSPECWVAPDFHHLAPEARTMPYSLTRFATDGTPTRNPFAASKGDTPCEWCRICDDHFPTDELCDHIFQGDCGYCGPGISDMEITDYAHRDIVRAALEYTGLAREIAAALRARKYEPMWSAGELDLDLQGIRYWAHDYPGADYDTAIDVDRDMLEAGYSWLYALDPKSRNKYMRAAVVATITWCDEWMKAHMPKEPET